MDWQSVVLALTFAAVAFAAYDDSREAPAAYSFAWGVDDDEAYIKNTHQETRNGDRTDGKYTILEADGSTREVAYYVDGDSGFIATVNGVRWPALPEGSNSGEARYVSKPKKVYAQAPIPVVYRPAPAPKVVYRPAPAPKVVYRPAPAPQVVRRDSSEERTGGATVSIQAPGYSISY